MKKSATHALTPQISIDGGQNEQHQKDSTVVELTLNSEQATQDNTNTQTSDTQIPNSQNQSIKESISRSMQEYFAHLGDQSATNLYQMVMCEVEPALLQAVLDHTRGNQSKASQALGLNRGTLRKKLQQYGIE